jgi:hypothetical protein
LITTSNIVPPNKMPPRHLHIVVCGLILLLPAGTKADEAKVAQFIESPAPGISAPLVWFRKDPGLNSGTGLPSLLAKSGGDLGARAKDPWGQADAAFGPSGSPPSGAAVAGSKAANLLGSDSGTALLFVKTPATLHDEALILEQGAWSKEAQSFDLRIRQGTSLVLMVGAPGTGAAPREFPLGKVVPGQWYFVALRWQKDSDDYGVDWLLGELVAGASAVQGNLRLPSVGAPDNALKIAGRARGETVDTPVVLTGGYLCNVAVYESRLGDEQINAIYSAALEGLK